MNYRLPIGQWGEACFDFISGYLGGFFAAFNWLTIHLNWVIETALTAPPVLVTILVLSALAWWAAGRRFALLSLIGFWLISNQGLWATSTETLALVLTATILSLVVAIPLGILLGTSATARAVLYPMLDFLQTMPRFVYLIPAAILLGIDVAPAVFATMTLAVPPPARLIATGLMEVDRQMVELAEANGCKPWQVMTWVKLPLAVPSILLGLNQCLMMALSMAVIASMIGAGGLGSEILTAISSLNAGQGVVAGLAIFILAVFLDRTSQGAARRLTASRQRSRQRA
ncbi:proline/glycine betaine ABC transporter permease [Rhodobacter sp. 24-YEA-8]|uniref:ABC transporter permease n=1 Tax=Rhodobacter sp. 24-YEA-8 TaxID=1884310 RepID=UPI000899E050|nr:ABC transporter permease subunit [Rhodobacter sp. 24-YEA-8]SED45135.1 glycine betaine/proline transport system permease protein/glycine betaine/proline transport system substrate-binding protein [Rhodobacter sp. 24-YEA-8]